MIRPGFVIALAAVTLTVAPAVVGWLIVAFASDSPYWDQIMIGDFLVRNHGRIFPDLGDLFAQHNESRKFFPRIVFFYLARLSGWNVKWEMASSLVVACAVVAVTWFLLRRQLDRVTAIGATAAAAMLILSPVQWWNWMFGIQLVVFIPPLMLGVALLSLRRGAVVPAAAAAVIATFSFANGILLWIALIPSLVFGASHRKRAALIWSAAGATTGLLYFWTYQKPRGHPPLILPFEAPLQFTGYSLAFLGHPLAWNRSLIVSMAVGAVLVLAFIACVTLAARARNSAALPWIAFGLYAALSAAAAAAGRLRLGLAQSLEPRYATFSVYFAVAVLLLLFVTASKQITSLAIVLFAAAHLLAVRSEWPYMQMFHRERLVGRAAVDFALVAAEHSALQQFVFDDVPAAQRTIAGLASINYLDPVLDPMVNALDAGAPPIFGDFAGLQRIPTGWGAFGWAWLPGPRPPDAVLLTRVTPAGDRILGVAPLAALEQRGIGEREPALRYSGWQYALPSVAVSSEIQLAAWSYDTRERRAYRMAGRFIVSGQTAARY